MRIKLFKSMVFILLMSFFMSSCTVVSPVVVYNLNKSEFKIDSTDTEIEKEAKTVKKESTIRNGILFGVFTDVIISTMVVMTFLNGVSNMSLGAENHHTDENL